MNRALARNICVTTCVFFALTGCGTIMQGSSQYIGFSSSPTKATVIVNGKRLGRTPITRRLSRKENHIVRFELRGFQPYEATFTRSVSGWVWGNILLGGIIGLAVDAMAGGMYKLTPQQIHAQMLKVEANAMGPTDGMAVFVVMRPDPSWEKIGSLTVAN